MSATNVVVYNPGKVPQSTNEYTVEELSRIRGIYRLHVLSGGGRYITQTAAAVYTTLTLPTPCKIEKLAWTHTAANGVTLSADALTITLDAYDHGLFYAPLRWYAYTGTASNVIQQYDLYETSNRLLITTTSTNTDLLFVYIDIVVAGDAV